MTVPNRSAVTTAHSMANQFEPRLWRSATAPTCCPQPRRQAPTQDSGPRRHRSRRAWRSRRHVAVSVRRFRARDATRGSSWIRWVVCRCGAEQQPIRIGEVVLFEPFAQHGDEHWWNGHAAGSGLGFAGLIEGDVRFGHLQTPQRSAGDTVDNAARSPARRPRHRRRRSAVAMRTLAPRAALVVSAT
jgi:hypothetical protein